MARNDLPSSSNRTSTLSRVVPGTSLTIIRSAWASVFTNVLLPVLRRPTMATFIVGSACAVLRPPSTSGSRSTIRSSSKSRLRFCMVLVQTSLAAAQLVEFVGLRIELRVVGLVGHADASAR